MESNSDSKTELIEALSQAARGKNRSKKARLEEIIDEVEECKKKGMSRREIVHVLAGKQLVMSEGTFATTRNRILKERGNRKHQVQEGPVEQKVAVKVKTQALEKVETKNTTGISREEMITMTNIPGLTDRKYKPHKPKGDSK